MNARRRFFPLAIAAAALLAGCSSYQGVPRSEILPDRSYQNVRVATLDGFEYRFERAEVLPDTLVGFYKVTVERSEPSKEEVWYEDVFRQQKIALARVARLELVRKDPVKTALYGASLAAAGFVLATLVDEASPGSSSGGSSGGGKPPITP
ncbi:MAG: hypothetical protein ACE15D_15910 [Candidatus Eisenbacteria bacterium]|nr:hypothetical protein [Candidatus Eisenbacteria bacterium]